VEQIAKVSGGQEKLIDTYFDELLKNAIAHRASDVHLENIREGMRIRMRVDGRLQMVKSMDKILANAMVAKIKIDSGAKVDEVRLPQDRRIMAKISGKRYDLRLSILPTIYGENIAIRIFDQESDLDLGGIGFDDEQLQLLLPMINCKNGLVLISGPTGCGKTTTLYAILKKISSKEKKVITIEDPVEYRLDGINQVAVNEEIGMSFSSILRSVLRQSPNVIMVGEIRDGTTAELAIQAALTGHLVFSTVHCGNAMGSITRLLDFKISPHLIKTCLRGAISQKLVRKPCEKCATTREPTDREIALFDGLSGVKIPKLCGCEHCSNRGYRGRTAVFDFMVHRSFIKENLASNYSCDAPVGEFCHAIGFGENARKLLAGRRAVFDDICPLLLER
jgi:type IV pilus assembly protein PilB